MCDGWSFQLVGRIGLMRYNNRPDGWFKCMTCGRDHRPDEVVPFQVDPLTALGEEVLAIQRVRWPATTKHIQGLKLAEEAGEACQALAREALGSSKPYDLAGELADVVIVAAGLAARCGIDLDAAVASKLARLRPTVVVEPDR